MITLLATLCHMATVSPGIKPIEFCQEQVIGQKDVEATPEALTVCYLEAQPIIAQGLQAGYHVRSIRCAKGDERPRDAI